MSGNLIEAFQQGWSFVDNIERQQKEDSWKDETRGRQRKEWAKDDDADAERSALYEKYFPKQQEEPAKPTTPQGTDIASKGIPIEAQPPAQTQHSPEATPADGQLVPAGGMPYTGIDAAYNKLRNDSTAGNRDLGDWAAGLRPEAGAGRGNVNPKMAVPEGKGIDRAYNDMRLEATAGNRNLQDWANGLKPTAAPVPATTPAPAPIAPAGTPIVANGNSTAGAGRGFVNPPQGTVTAADRSVAPGKVDITNMTPEQKDNLLKLAEKQFGMRFAKAGPADVAQAAPAAAPAAPRGAELAAGLPVDVKTNPSGIDRRNDLNHMLNFAIDSAKIDLKRGKADGAGLATLIKTAQTIKAEGMDRAVALMAQGRFQEAQDLYNSAGGHADMQIVSTQDSFIKVAGQQIPTKLVTMRSADGSTRTVNTAEFQMQGMEISKQLDAALKGEQIAVTKEHYQGMREDRREDNADRAAARADANAQRSELMQIRREEAEDRKAARAERAPVGPKLPEPVKLRMQGIQKREDIIDTQRAKVLAEGGNTAALDKELLALSLERDALIEPHMPQANRVARPEPTKPGQTAQAAGVGAATAAKGVPTKAEPKKEEAKPAAPAYVPPADSPAGRAAARREAAQAEQSAAAKAKDAAKRPTQEAFAADLGKLSPVELARKYDGKRGDLTKEQVRQLFEAQQKI